MAIAKQEKNPVINADPKLVSDVYDTITDNPIDAKVKCISKDLEGTPLETTYYAQRLGRDDSFKFQDVNLSPSYQSYIKITGLVLNVIESMDFDIDTTTGIATGTGIALVAQYMKFNPGDAFYAKGINNERTLYRVDTVELTSVHRGSPYRVTYSLVGPVTDSSPEVIDLENKVYKEYFYDENFVTTCSGPLLTEEAAATLEEVDAAYLAIIREYMRLFADRDTDAILYEVGGIRMFDPFLHDFLVKTIPVEHYVRRSLRGFNTNDIELYTIFNYVLDPGVIDYTTPTTRIAVLPKNGFQGKRASMYLYFTTVEYFVDTAGTSIVTDLFPVTRYAGELDIDGTMVPLLPDLTSGEYVVSDAFYTGTYDTVLEIELNKLIQREELSMTNLLALARSFKSWSGYEQFYAGAILLTLLKIGSSVKC